MWDSAQTRLLARSDRQAARLVGQIVEELPLVGVARPPEPAVRGQLEVANVLEQLNVGDDLGHCHEHVCADELASLKYPSGQLLECCRLIGRSLKDLGQPPGVVPDYLLRPVQRQKV